MQTLQEYMESDHPDEFKKFVNSVHYAISTEITNRFSAYETLPIECVRRETREMVNQFDMGFVIKAAVVEDIVKTVGESHGNKFC